MDFNRPILGCRVCNQFESSSRSDMERHVAIVHAKGTYSTFRCVFCDGRFYDVDHLVQHTGTGSNCNPNGYYSVPLTSHQERNFSSLVDQIIVGANGVNSGSSTVIEESSTISSILHSVSKTADTDSDSKKQGNEMDRVLLGKPSGHDSNILSEPVDSGNSVPSISSSWTEVVEILEQDIEDQRDTCGTDHEKMDFGEQSRNGKNSDLSANNFMKAEESKATISDTRFPGIEKIEFSDDDMEELEQLTYDEVAQIEQVDPVLPLENPVSKKRKSQRSQHCSRLVRGRHDESGRIQCNLCQEKLLCIIMKRINLRAPMEHALKHVEKPLFRCLECNENFTHWYGMRHHQKGRHSKTSVKGTYEDYTEKYHEEIIEMLDQCYGKKEVKERVEKEELGESVAVCSRW